MSMSLPRKTLTVGVMAGFMVCIAMVSTQSVRSRQADNPLDGCDSNADCLDKCEECDLATNTCVQIPGCCDSDAYCLDKCEECDLLTNTCVPIIGCCGDVNGDGFVTVNDLVEVLLCFGDPATPPCDTGQDVNLDGTVNVLDLIDLLLAFGTSCP